MGKIGFSSDKYIELQSNKIKERVSKFNRLYLEFGGKLFDDYHASRVLPGFKPDNKINLLLNLKDKIEIIIAVSAEDIENNKIRSDYNITYAQDTLRLKELFKSLNIDVCGVNITHFTGQEKAKEFKKMLTKQKIQVSYNYLIPNYPNDIDLILSKDGFGKNEYLETHKNIIVVTAPGPGSGKLATCLNQMYHDNLNGVKSGYAKFETFPIWSLPLNHPVNIAYEAATIDLEDFNMIDPFHMEAYNEVAINYNRDVEAFPVLNELLKKITNKRIYKSPTDMGVNMAGFAIVDDNVCKEASKQEILRRYYNTKVDFLNSDKLDDKLARFVPMFQKCGIDLTDRKIAKYTKDLAAKEKKAIVTIEVEPNKYITGKQSNLMSATSACLLNTLKYLAKIDDIKILDEDILKQVIYLKENYIKSNSFTLNSLDMLEVLSVCALNSKDCKKALDALGLLSGLDAHSSTLLSKTDLKVLKKLKITVTQDCD